MMYETFTFNDGTKRTVNIVRQDYRKFDEMTIQISYVCVGVAFDLKREFENKISHIWRREDGEDCELVYRYIYSEINNDDIEQYCSFYSEHSVWENYPWFFMDRIPEAIKKLEASLAEFKKQCKGCKCWECGHCAEPKFDMQNRLAFLKSQLQVARVAA
jgi:hypothetical protein